MNTSDKIIFAKRLSFLLGADIPLPKALEIITSQSRAHLQPLLKTISEKVHTGKHFSSSLEEFPRSFPFYFIQLVRAGEHSGRLKQNLEHIATDLERRKLLQQKIIGALLYPCVIVAGTVCLSLFLLFIIFPKIKNLFQSLHATLPLSTRSVLWFSDAVHNFGFACISLLIVSITALLYALKKSEHLQYKKDALLLNIPIVNKLLKYYILSSFLRCSGTMLQTHIPIARTIAYATDGVEHKVYKHTLSIILKEVSSGKTISQTIRLYPKLFPRIIIELIEIGEMSGELSRTMLYLSTMLDQEIETMLKTIVTLVEPLLMAGIGLIIGFISLSIISPIYEITQNIKH